MVTPARALIVFGRSLRPSLRHRAIAVLLGVSSSVRYLVVISPYGWVGQLELLLETEADSSRLFSGRLRRFLYDAGRWPDGLRTGLPPLSLSLLALYRQTSKNKGAKPEEE